MSLDFSDIAEERMIDRYGYDCDLCSWRSHEVRRRLNSDDVARCLCDSCHKQIESEIEAEELAKELTEENTLTGVCDEQYAFGERVKAEAYL